MIAVPTYPAPYRQMMAACTEFRKRPLLATLEECADGEIFKPGQRGRRDSQRRIAVQAPC